MRSEIPLCQAFHPYWRIEKPDDECSMENEPNNKENHFPLLESRLHDGNVFNCFHYEHDTYIEQKIDYQDAYIRSYDDL